MQVDVGSTRMYPGYYYVSLTLVLQTLRVMQLRANLRQYPEINSHIVILSVSVQVPVARSYIASKCHRSFIR